MPHAGSSSSPAPSCRALAIAFLGLWGFAIARLTVEGGPRSAPGYNRRKFAPCPKCGKKVRVEADGWGYCRNCRQEFRFKSK